MLEMSPVNFLGQQHARGVFDFRVGADGDGLGRHDVTHPPAGALGQQLLHLLERLLGMNQHAADVFYPICLNILRRMLGYKDFQHFN